MRRPSDAMIEADAVFTGVVEQVEVVGSPSTAGDLYAQRVTYAARQATFRIRTVWKGVVSALVAVETPIDEAACGFEFSVGKEYLVYAVGSPRLVTTICARTRLTREAEEDVLILGEGVPHAAEYDAVIQRCQVQARADCCLASVQRMAAGRYQLAPPAGCPNGFRMNHLNCEGTLRWCEPIDD